MIHSLSGGVLGSSEIFTYLYVRFENGNAEWFLSPIPVAEGKTVYASQEKIPARGVVERVRSDTASNAPVPFKRMKEIDGIE
ncbi:MAG: hypothetical protein J6C93_00210 [Clostridia bacterium]|nr:hypothetical protein [Clostridia bacterium]